MQLTNKAEYAVRLIMYLASRPSETVKAESISRAELIPRQFLSQMTVDLRKAGLLEAIRGLGGGLRLAKAAEKITVLDVVEAIEGPISVFKCVNQADYCKKSAYCPLCGLWQSARNRIEEVFSQTSISDLLDKKISSKQKAV